VAARPRSRNIGRNSRAGKKQAVGRADQVGSSNDPSCHLVSLNRTLHLVLIWNKNKKVVKENPSLLDLPRAAGWLRLVSLVKDTLHFTAQFIEFFRVSFLRCLGNNILRVSSGLVICLGHRSTSYENSPVLAMRVTGASWTQRESTVYLHFSNLALNSQ
jgi:hypothetical protein